MTASLRNPHTESAAPTPRPRFAAIAVALGIAAFLDASSTLAQATGERDGILTNADGRTLYTYDRDDVGISNCTNVCAFAWPPFLAKDGATGNGSFMLITRADGRKQWARDGKPLYLYVGDPKAGDAHGDHNGGMWHVARTGTSQASTAKMPSGGSKDDDYGYYGRP